jgi:hypothetical protein
MESDCKHLFFRQEIETADGFLHVEAFLLLACINVPHSDGLIVAPAE